MITVIHVDTERTWRGGEKQVFHLVSGLPRNEFKSVIAAPVKSALYDKAIKTGVTVIPLRSSGEVSIRQFLDLKRGANRHNANLFHVHTSHGLISASIVREISKNSIKVIYSRRTDFHLRTSFLDISRKKYLWGADRIISVSDGIKRVLALDGIPENRVTTIYSGINPADYSPEVSDKTVRQEFGIPGDVPLVGMVSALAHHKDPVNFLRAAEFVCQVIPNTVFLLIGAGNMWETMNSYKIESQINEQFVMTGFRHDIPRLLSALDLFCISSRKEGLCTSILDAMAMELAVVSTRAGGIPEAVVDGETGLLAPIENSKALAEHIITLLKNPDTRIKMGKAGRERVKSVFDIRHTIAKTADIYRELANG